jgi:hypothetical protein
MSYLEEDDPDLIEDLLHRKEFYWTKKWNRPAGIIKSFIPRFLREEAKEYGIKLDLHSYQHFIHNIINPNTPYKRQLLLWDTGTGKTIGALSAAMEFINTYHVEYESGNSTIGTVFIIGFSKRQFINDLLRFPEFGFITREERQEMDHLRLKVANGSKEDTEKYAEKMSIVRKRLTSRKNYGFFKFYGYKEFVNRIFRLKDMDINQLSEEEIREAISNNKIEYNEDLIAEFKNSLMICDEIHNVYNSLEKNNWGIALQSVLDKETTCRAIFMSATPINNSPTEIVDIMNLLLPKELRLKKPDFFDKSDELKPAAFRKIAELCRGRVSFLKDTRPEYFPELRMAGEHIKGIPYLRFIRCPMSKFHYKTYKEVYTGSLSQDSQYLVDFVMPNPDNPKIGLYQTAAIKSAISGAPQKWKDVNGIDYVNGKLVGELMKKENITEYSAKYAELLEEIFHIIRHGRGKICMYHNIVIMSGILFIAEMLSRNGIIDEYSNPTDTTLCVICGKKRAEHKKDQIAGGSGVRIDRKSTDLNTIVDIYNNDKLALSLRKKVKYCVQQDFSASLNYILNAAAKEKDSEEIHKEEHKESRSCRYHYVISLADIHNIKSEESSESVSDIINRLINNFGEHEIDRLKDKSANTDISITVNFSPDVLDTYPGIKSPAKFNKKATHKDAIKGGAKKKKHKSEATSYVNHFFKPARYIIIHSEIEKPLLETSLDKYNSSSNCWGHNYLILLGAKSIKESVDLKAVQNIFIVGKPENIQTLIQIRGRAVRNNSHRDLPPENRIVNFKIFTTCLPDKSMSYEEEKYKEKIHTFQTIQQIEKIFHENAADGYINKESIERSMENNDPLGPLPYKNTIDMPNRPLKLHEIENSTFDIFYAKKEVEIIKVLIKKLFLDISPVWNYKELLEACRNPRIDNSNMRKCYQCEINTELIKEDSFVIALSQLLWNNETYIEPVFNNNDIFIDRINNPNDKIIMYPNKQEYVIYLISSSPDLYCLFPLDTETRNPIIDVELPYRMLTLEKPQRINMNSFVQNKKVNFDYDDKKKIFYRKWVDISIENMENVVCEYGTYFHSKFLEECIEYVFGYWTDKNIKKHAYHHFYFKMLYYYDLLSLVMWAYTCKPHVFKYYEKYVNTVKANDIKMKALEKYNERQYLEGKPKESVEDIKNDIKKIKKDKKLAKADKRSKKSKIDPNNKEMPKNKEEEEEYKEIELFNNSDVASSGIINLLKTSINRTSNYWVPAEFREQYEQTLEQVEELRQKRLSNKKASALHVPIGHYIGKFPKIYDPERGWNEDPTYNHSEEAFIENDTIIGYDERSKMGVHVRFKIRNPIQNIKKYTDVRMIEKGSVCKSKSKPQLFEIAKKLGIKISDKLNVDELCVLIRSKLIRNELKERIAKTNTKWFYFHYEDRPDIIKI